MQTQMASSLTSTADIAGLERKEVSFHCPEHGEMMVTISKLSIWSVPSCPQCRLQEEQRQAELEERKQQAVRQERIASRLRNSGIPLRFQGKDFSSYTPPTVAAAKNFALCCDYAENFPSFAARGTSLILCGVAGTGKTHLACAIAHHIITQHGKSALYHQVSSVLRQVKETYNKTSKRTEQEVINLFAAPDLLILDEIGVQFGTDAERNILFEIVNSRYEQMKPSILISNLNITGLVDYAGERTIDRMRENGGLMRVFDWDSYRGN